MTPPERTRGTRVELLARAELPTPAAGQRDHLVDRLADLASDGVLAEFDVSAWPKRMRRDGTADATTRDRYLAFSAWARDRSVRLTPFFGTRECYSMETGERGEWVVLPVLCLAIHEDGDLAAVYPHADGDTYRSVLSGVKSLEDRTDAGSSDLPPLPAAD
jgi:hypothetical protein